MMSSHFYTLLFVILFIVSANGSNPTQQIIPNICPDHFFHPGVWVECIYDHRSGSTTVKPFLRIHARSTIDYLLNYTVLEDMGVQYAPSMFVDVMSFPRDNTDPTEFVDYQSQAGEEYVDRLVGIAIDGVPIYTALGVGGYDMLNPAGSFSDVAPLKVDECGGTYGPTPDGIRYHYRTIPACVHPPLNPRDMWNASLVSTLSNFDHDILAYHSNVDVYRSRRARLISDSHDLLEAFSNTQARKQAKIVGWTMQGHPIFSPFNNRGLLHDNMDNCNGKFDDRRNYGYYSKPTFPYLVGCFGPGVYSLAEEDSTLEMLPAEISKRRFGACPAGHIPTADFSSNGCTPCPAGRYTTNTYQKAGQVFSPEEGCNLICPIGYYCPSASSKPIKCPAGRYGSSAGIKDMKCSGACRSGYFCPTGSKRPDPYPCGHASFYCPTESPARLKVDLGFYSTPEVHDDTTRSTQTICGTGTYCENARRYPCPAGRFGTTMGLHSANCSDICPVGNYCPLSSPDPILCPAGTYGNTTGLSTSDCTGLCQPGYYCPAGSTVATQIPCAPGIYGAEAGLGTKECSPLCEGIGAGAPNATSSDGTKFCMSRDCAAGYYCPIASTSATQQPCGSASVFCPPSSALPTPVSPGYYTVGPLSAPENMQVTGPGSDESIRFSQKICEPGFYCISGVRYRCPLGTYGGSTGLSSMQCSGPCDAGFICPLNSTSAQQQPCGHSADVYCPVGSYRPITVPAGYYSVGMDHTTRQSILPCPPGMWCVDGVKRLCAAGKYSVNGSPTAKCDGLCKKGYYCSAGSSSSTQHNCPPGRYGHLGMIDANCKGSCYIGYYCPVNSFSPTQFECGGEQYYCPHGSGARNLVQSGYFSAGGNATTRHMQVKCDIGTYFGTPPAGKMRTNICPSTTMP